MIKNNFKKGFTLLEALVAISILMVAVVAPITISQKGLSSAVYTKNQMIASYLAQDAIEYIKNKRDNNAINSTEASPIPWLNGFGDCMVSLPLPVVSSSLKWCKVDTNSTDGVNGPGSGIISKDNVDDFLKIDNGFYGFNGSMTTNFTRKFNIVETVANRETRLEVVVSWGTDPANSVDVNTWIYNY